MQPITFTSHGDTVSGNLFLPGTQATTKLAFLFLHGWRGRQNIGAARALAGIGFTCLTYDMRGNGQSEGDMAKLTKAEFLDDAAIAYDYLKQQIGEETSIGAVGSSFGSYLSILLSELRDVRCLSLRVPANYPDDTFNQPELLTLPERAQFYGEWRRRELGVNDNKALRALHGFNDPVQIIRAGSDEQLPEQTTQNFINAIADKNRLKYDIMNDAPHSLVNGRLQAEYESLLTAWAKQFL
jgi:uncharacterized protein